MTIESLWVIKGPRSGGQCYWNPVRVGAVEEGSHNRRCGHRYISLLPSVKHSPTGLRNKSPSYHLPNCCLCLPLAETSRVRRLVSLDDAVHWYQPFWASSWAERMDLKGKIEDNQHIYSMITTKLWSENTKMSLLSTLRFNDSVLQVLFVSFKYTE